ncbi:hypothetical protein [Treponema parvum]|uniref:hypothetical protein n=1 Tax=Treponema parvum TaxID=138851 RepID=UPI001AEBB2DC|nr:hypothetical protein [Treponema parvum]QTQ15693.1 hypothetical protein HXT04_02675 [Treponema parvum]
MSKWSEELQKNTRHHVFPGAIVKDENHNYGVFMLMKEGVVIKAIKGSNSSPAAPEEETIAVFGSIDEMVDASWVLD